MAEVRILLIDDEAQFVAATAKRLRRRGFTVLEANSGPEGLSLLEQESVDAVVLDVGMPGMDGIQVLRELRMRHPQVRVLMLTGHADMEVAISGMAMGAFDYLMKPVDVDVLAGKIRGACSRKTNAGVGRTMA